MPIFEKQERRIAFIHVPKAAGSSIESMFRNDGWSMTFFRKSMDGFSVSPQHMIYSRLRDNIPDLDDLTSFTIVRDPFARLVSEWRYQTEKMKTSDLGFNDFVRHVDCSLKQNVQYWDNHWRPQTDFMDERIDQVFKVENMADLLPKFLEEKNIMTNPRIPHTNRRRSGDRNWKRHFKVSSESRDRILRMYDRDYSEFGYDKFIPVAD